MGTIIWEHLGVLGSKFDSPSLKLGRSMMVKAYSYFWPLFVRRSPLLRCLCLICIWCAWPVAARMGLQLLLLNVLFWNLLSQCLNWLKPVSFCASRYSQDWKDAEGHPCSTYEVFKPGAPRQGMGEAQAPGSQFQSFHIVSSPWQLGTWIVESSIFFLPSHLKMGQPRSFEMGRSAGCLISSIEFNRVQSFKNDLLIFGFQMIQLTNF